MAKKNKIPFDFILDHLYPEEILIKPMFGCYGLYLDNKMIFFLRDRKDKPQLNGIWVAASQGNYSSLIRELPGIHQDLTIRKAGRANEKWLLLSVSDENFESLAVKACKMVLKKDKRIGKITQSSFTGKV